MMILFKQMRPLIAVILVALCLILDGEVIGINTAIFSQSGGSVGIGFAIASNLAENVVLPAQAIWSDQTRLAGCLYSGNYP